ncbi:MAG: hypothetical protein LBH00_02480 [Planctomycetaceae bacterium]|nr:hypothetical protein [Planctomycetaceae bacterium]
MISWRLSDASATYCGGDGSQEKWRYEEPYDSDHNRHQWNGTFCWGARPAAGKERPEDYWTNVMGITGPDTAFDLQTLKKLDSCGHLIFAVSVKNSGVHWAEPGDLDVRNLPADLRKGIDGKGFHALFLDGTVWFIRKDVPMELLENFLTASRARKNNRNDKLIRYAKELHHGGHFPSYADRCEEYERD